MKKCLLPALLISLLIPLLGGAVRGDKVVVDVAVFRDGQNVKATYSGTIETTSKMTGILEYIGDPDRPRARWISAKR